MAPITPERSDGDADIADGGLEETPDVHLALMARRRLAHVAIADPQRGDPSGIAVQAAARQQAGGQCQAEDSGQRGVAELRVDLVRDGLQGVEVARGVEIEKLLNQLVSTVEHGEPLAQLLVVEALAHVDGRLRGRIGVDGGRVAWPARAHGAGGRVGCGRRWRWRATRLTKR